jgi:hypothetical protein
MADDRTGDYTVGYGKPPHQTQFKKGQSGNPKGRTKGSKNLAALIMSALNEPVTVTQNGRRKRITKIEAMTTQLANKGASGDPKATQLLLGVVQLFEDRAETPAQTNAVGDADRQVMQLLFSRIQRIGNGGTGEAPDSQ